MAEPRYRVAIVGTGGIARFHARGWNGRPETQVVAASDIREEALARFAEEFPGIATYTDLDELLAQEQPDIVSICTWPGSHASLTVQCAEAGVRRILCEKPMATSLGEADAMIEAAERNGVKLAIGHNRRFYPRNTEARRLIAEGIIGTPHLIRMATSGGLLNNGTHAIDRVRYLLGDPEAQWVMGQVERRTDRYERAQPIEDCCAGLIVFQDGTRLIIETDLPQDELTQQAASFQTLQVYGTDGILELGEGIRLLNGTSSGWQSLEVPEDTDQFEEMIAWIEGRREHRNAAPIARATVELMMAIYESVRIKGRVDLPLQTRESPLRMMIEDGTLPVERPGRYDIRLR